MQIWTIYIGCFGGLNDFKLDFKDGINVIEGKNESGKTTVCSFIKFIFYGFKDKRERSLYLNWNSDTVSGYLIIRQLDRTYRIERTCTGSGTDSVKIIDINTNTSVYDNMLPSDVFLKVPSDVFDRTIYVKQADNGRIDGRGIGEAIENLLYSADETINTDKALKKLDDARTILLHKNEKGGKIYELETELDYLNVRLDKAIESNRDIVIKENYINRMKQLLSDNTQRQTEITTELKYYETVKSAVKYNELIELKSKLTLRNNDIEDLKSEYMSDAGFLPDLEYIEKIKFCESEIEQYKETLDNIDEQLKKIDEMTPRQEEFLDTLARYGGQISLSEKIDNYILRRRTMVIFGSIFSLLCTFLFITAGLIAVFYNPIGALVSIIAAIFLIGAVLCFVNASRQKVMCQLIYDDFEVKNDNELESYIENMLEETINNKDRRDNTFTLHKNRENILLQRDEKAIELEDYLQKWNKSSVSKTIADAEKYLYLLREKQYEYEKTKNQFNIINQYFIENDFDENQLKNVEIITIDENQIKLLRREYDYIHQSNEALKTKIYETEKLLIALQTENESPSLIADEIANLKNKVTHLRKCHDSYLLAYEKLSEASVGLKETSLPKLTSYASELINRFTAGKYDTLGIGHDLKLEYTADNKTHKSIFMSAGTLDIAYLSLRFALIKLLYRDINPPVLLDESFARLDDVRFENVLRFLSDISGDGTQIIIFTSQKRDAVVMKNAVTEFNHIILGGN